MSKLPFIKFYPSDWLGGTRGLSAAETGVYITLVCLMYEHAAPIEEDHSRLARQCGCTVRSFTRALDCLTELGKVVRMDGGLWNERVGRELGDVANRRQKAMVGANQRWNSSEQNSKQNQRPSDASASRKQCLDDAIPEARTQIEEVGGGVVRAREANDLFGAVTAAAGIGRDGRWPERWMPPAAAVHVERWRRDLGLTEAEIVAVVDAQIARHGEPPASPKAYDRAMAALAGQKAAPAPEPIPPTAPATNGAHHEPRTTAAHQTAQRRQSRDEAFAARIAERLERDT